MLKLKNIFFFLIALTLTNVGAQEENPYLNYEVPSQNLLKYNRFLINPTFSTVREDKSYINFLHRNQSANFADNNQNYFLSYSGRVNDRTGLGLSVYQQTIDGLNKGYTLQQTVESVKLADSLKKKPNLQEFYGSVSWGVRSIFLHYVGWFDGNPTNLYPLTSAKEAKHIIELAGGEKKMLNNLNKAVNNGDYQWGLQLADYLLQTDYKKTKITNIKIKLLRSLAAQQINAPARNYYLSYAYELEKNNIK